jgi:hypothetical protein
VTRARVASLSRKESNTKAQVAIYGGAGGGEGLGVESQPDWRVQRRRVTGAMEGRQEGDGEATSWGGEQGSAVWGSLRPPPPISPPPPYLPPPLFSRPVIRTWCRLSDWKSDSPSCAAAPCSPTPPSPPPVFNPHPTPPVSTVPGAG